LVGLKRLIDLESNVQVINRHTGQINCGAAALTKL